MSESTSSAREQAAQQHLYMMILRGYLPVPPPERWPYLLKKLQGD